VDADAAAPLMLLLERVLVGVNPPLPAFVAAAAAASGEANSVW